jgi:hypothetical protein
MTPHVVVDADYVEAAFREQFCWLRANQACRTRNERNRHVVLLQAALTRRINLVGRRLQSSQEGWVRFAVNRRAPDGYPISTPSFDAVGR